ncbi:MAG: dienelactone hydrolase family protein [Rubrivivax sp.]
MLKEDFETLVPARGGIDRRTFVQGTLGSGFAAAVLPVMAQTVIKTSADGLDVGEATVTVGDFKMPVYHAAPKGKRNLPVVLVISEIFGVHQHIADVARRFAHQGYFAVAPELFLRQGDAEMYGEIAKLIAEVISKVPDEQVMGDLDATVAWAGTQGADTSRIGITGFCWGGRITWLYSAHNPAVKAGVAWYGRLTGPTSALNPKQPLDVVGSLKGPVLGLYGGADSGIPLDTVEQMKAALTRGSPAAKASEFVVYPAAPHAFHADYRPSHREAAATDGWKRCLAWFASHGLA